MASFEVTETIVTLQCANCAMTFGVPKRFDQDRRNDHNEFYCPAGHTNIFRGESVEERLRRERDIAKQQLARAEEEAAVARRQAEAARKETRRLKKRTAAGTCPCCQRTFSNMAVHMKKQHPQFVAEQTSNIVPMKKAK